MTHTLISQLALDRAKTILENSDFWSGPAAAKTSAEAVTVLRALGGDPPKQAKPDESAVIVEAMGLPIKPKQAVKTKEEPPQQPDESKPADV